MTKNQQHTPGPWHVGMQPGPIIYDSRYGSQIVRMDNPFGQTDEDNLANAHLIAAAPEMLAALQQVYTRLELEESENPNGTYLCAAMRGTIGRAIKKAKGEIE